MLLTAAIKFNLSFYLQTFRGVMLQLLISLKCLFYAFMVYTLLHLHFYLFISVKILQTSRCGGIKGYAAVRPLQTTQNNWFLGCRLQQAHAGCCIYGTLDHWHCAIDNLGTSLVLSRADHRFRVSPPTVMFTTYASFTTNENFEIAATDQSQAWIGCF